jgi:hypothetical protein
MTFREPARDIPLRFGTYSGRYVAGLSLLISGLICLQGASATVPIAMAVGSLAHAVGWWVLPSRGRRRAWISIASLTISWILLIGPAGVGLLAGSFAGWLYLRQRPAIAYVLIVPVFAAGLAIRAIDSQYEAMIPALGAMAIVIVGCAWLARAVSAAATSKRGSTARDQLIE